HLHSDVVARGGSASISISEAFLQNSNTLVNFAFAGGPLFNNDSTNFSQGVSVLDVSKDISADGDRGLLAKVSNVEQTFSQADTPEPASLALVSIGALGAFGYRLLRRRPGR